MISVNRLSVNKTATGFTLIEVLLAMAVFALAGLALLNTSDSHFSALDHVEKRMIANWVVSNQLVGAHLDKQWPPKNNEKGEQELAGKTWYWQKKVIKTTDAQMRAVVIEVRASEKDEEPTASMMTYVSKGGRK